MFLYYTVSVIRPTFLYTLTSLWGVSLVGVSQSEVGLTATLHYTFVRFLVRLFPSVFGVRRPTPSKQHGSRFFGFRLTEDRTHDRTQNIT